MAGTKYRAVAIGVSSGGLQALSLLLGRMPADLPLALLIVQHLGADSGDGFARLLDHRCALHVKEADEGEMIRPGVAYLAPPNYHLLVENDGALALSVDPPVSYARPSVDVLFETAAMAFGEQLIGIVLTGANADGSRGLKAIHEHGGLTVVQDPAEADSSPMPLAALAATPVHHVLALAQIANLLLELSGSSKPR